MEEYREYTKEEKELERQALLERALKDKVRKHIFDLKGKNQGYYRDVDAHAGYANHVFIGTEEELTVYWKKKFSNEATYKVIGVNEEDAKPGELRDYYRKKDEETKEEQSKNSTSI